MPLVDERAVETTRRWLAVCKGCDHADSVAGTVRRTTRYYALPSGGATRPQTSEELVDAERPLGASTGWYRVPLARQVTLAREECAACGSTRLRQGAVAGRATDATCDPRCEGATGFSCECACGGANHGKAHG